MPRKKQHQWRTESSDREQTSTKPSRSAQKRRSHALQEIGARLVALAPETLSDHGLPPALLDAARQYSRMRSHEARRRQMQYIGRLMRELDEVTLEKLLHSGIARLPATESLLAVTKVASALDEKSPNV